MPRKIAPNGAERVTTGRGRLESGRYSTGEGIDRSLERVRGQSFGKQVEPRIRLVPLIPACPGQSCVSVARSLRRNRLNRIAPNPYTFENIRDILVFGS